MNKKLAGIIAGAVVIIIIGSIIAFYDMPETESPETIEIMIIEITVKDVSISRNDIDWSINNDTMFALGSGKEFQIRDDVNISIDSWVRYSPNKPFNFFNDTNTLNFTLRNTQEDWIEVVFYGNQDNVTSPYRWCKNIPNQTSIQLTQPGTSNMLSKVYFEGVSGNITIMFRQIGESAR